MLKKFHETLLYLENNSMEMKNNEINHMFYCYKCPQFRIKSWGNNWGFYCIHLKESKSYKDLLILNNITGNQTQVIKKILEEYKETTIDNQDFKKALITGESKA